MWPRILLELLPHLTKLAPTVADRFLPARASDHGNEAAIAAMAETFRGDLGQVAEVHAGIQRTLAEQGRQVTEVAVEVTRARIGIESVEARVAKLEQTAAVAMRLIALMLLMLAGSLVLLAVILMHVSHR